MAQLGFGGREVICLFCELLCYHITTSIFCLVEGEDEDWWRFILLTVVMVVIVLLSSCYIRTHLHTPIHRECIQPHYLSYQHMHDVTSKA